MAYHTSTDLVKYFNFPYYLKNAKLATATLLHLASEGVTDVYEHNVSNYDNVTVFPNPFNESFIINFENNDLTIPKNISILNIFGDEIYSNIFQKNNPLIKFESMPSGVYFVKLTFDNKTIIKKIVKQ